ncbi:transporter substrate-binding domain-containing protein [Breoghania sp. JC706]|uniref:substrate-binding periplasmic protein n=1 Tax=Breoghania sp. JC706 TaxID=3117732 RepID=UPI00300AEEDB
MRAVTLAALAVGLTLVSGPQAGPVPAHAEPQTGPHLHFASGHNPPLSNDQQTGFNDLILKEALRRTGIGLSLRRVPTGRAGPLVNAGTEDGCGPRILGFSKAFPELVVVDEPVITFEFVAFSRKQVMSFNGWDSLGEYTVGHLTGSVILERNAKRHAGAAISVQSVPQLFEMLERGRIDIAIIERWTGLHEVKKQGLRDVRMLSPDLARKPMYFFLNRKFAPLAPRIAQAIREMKQDGTYDRLMVHALNPLLAEF